MKVTLRLTKEERDFFYLPDQFEEELVEELFKPLKRKKIEHPYLEPQVQDAETIEIERKKEDNEFFDLEQKFNAIDNSATEQQQKNDLINLVDDVLDENNPFNNKIKTRHILKTICLMILTQKTKNVSDGVIKEINFGNNIEISSDDEVAIDGPKKKKKNTNTNSVDLGSNRII